MVELRSFQIWLQERIVEPEPSPQPWENWVRGDFGLDAADRVDIYRSMYPMRMVEALQTDYPGLAWALGEERFSQLVWEYVQVHPSRSWTLNRLGDALPEFVRATAGRPRTFLFELALLERELCRVFEAEEVEPFQADPGQLPQRLVPRPSSGLLAFRYPVSSFLQQIDTERKPRHPLPERQYVLVFRRRFQMGRRHLSRSAWQLLAWLWQGIPLETALVRAARRFPELLPETLQQWFEEWARWEVFRKEAG